MKRLTTDTPSGNFETMLNFVYGKDGWTYIRHDGEHENVRLTDWAKRQCKLHGCDEVWTETPEEIDQRLCDCMMEGPICPIAMAYCFASQAVHLRSRLSSYEDTGLEPEDFDALQKREQGLAELLVQVSCGCAVSYARLTELAQAEKDGRLVMLQGGVTVHYLQEEYRKAKCMADERLPSPDYTTGRISGFGAGVIYILDKILTQEEAEAALKKREAGKIDNR